MCSFRRARETSGAALARSFRDIQPKTRGKNKLTILWRRRIRGPFPSMRFSIDFDDENQ